MVVLFETPEEQQKNDEKEWKRQEWKEKKRERKKKEEEKREVHEEEEENGHFILEVISELEKPEVKKKVKVRKWSSEKNVFEDKVKKWSNEAKSTNSFFHSLSDFLFFSFSLLR